MDLNIFVMWYYENMIFQEIHEVDIPMEITMGCVFRLHLDS